MSKNDPAVEHNLEEHIALGEIADCMLSKVLACPMQSLSVLIMEYQ